VQLTRCLSAVAELLVVTPASTGRITMLETRAGCFLLQLLNAGFNAFYRFLTADFLTQRTADYYYCVRFLKNRFSGVTLSLGPQI